MQAEIIPADIARYSFTSAVWRGFVPPKIELISWFVLDGRVNTKDRLCRLGVIAPNDNMCVLCCKAVESAFHLFIGCEVTCQVWSAWLFALGRLWTMPGSLKEHFQSWTTGSVRKEDTRRWFMGFYAVIWTIWVERNATIFRNQDTNVEGIISMSFEFSDEWFGGEPYGY
ncbi:uncharacterized protein LOC130981433 [Arachis stenosperma]|uniref:uncharacterized protein LOC130981433 n=1 Tax=Arachis stenosperma TaxID=217475 RepID=UPI0025AC6735|nr:uncharacterized protein LOC130981433 [Arachis stenosperma]